MLLVVFSGTRVWATTVVVIRTSDAQPYAQADAAVHERLGQQQFDVRSLLIRDVSQQSIEKSIGKPDAVVAIGTSAARWLHKELPPSIKLVYCMVSNARDAGLLDGRNVCGVTTGWRVEAVAVNDYPSVADAIDALTQKRVDVIWTMADQKLYDSASVRALLLAALRAKIPVWGFSPAFVRAGALLGVGVEPRSQGTQVADLVMRLLADPAKAPVGAASPDQFQIAVNFIVAEQLGVAIPDSLSSRAAYVYRTEQ